MTRTVKTPGQRATEAYLLAVRMESRATRKRDKAQTDLEAAQTELDHATKRRGFLGQDPDLPEDIREPEPELDEEDVPPPVPVDPADMSAPDEPADPTPAASTPRRRGKP